jgi:hypothetical protein
MRLFVSILGLSTINIVLLADEKLISPGYVSPYRIEYSEKLHDLFADLKKSERGEQKNQSSIAFDKWDSAEVRKKYGSWGPPARHYSAPQGIEKRSLQWQRERVIAVAMFYEGYSYQHHHIPDWDPPKDWPWKEVARGHNAKGIDCSNFTAFVYS